VVTVSIADEEEEATGQLITGGERGTSEEGV
jgi:hypothetical protein